ncbi:hypothetical protein MBLNU230_g6301t1 [Neophaeotheca triangularis]
MKYSNTHVPLLIALSHSSPSSSSSKPNQTPQEIPPNNSSVNLNWHPPIQSNINSLSSAINGTGTYGFIYNSSQGPPDADNWCNMPHVNPKTYPRVDDTKYKLEYVQVIHRHHKRTPYASNTFPIETYPWNCDDQGLFYGGKPLNPPGNASASTYWNVYTSPSNPLRPDGFPGTCQFPQITRGGLDDSHQHGADLKAVYNDLLHFLPATYSPDTTSYRVTNNVITSQVASMLIAAMHPTLNNTPTPLAIQPPSIDSLEPSYPCPASKTLYQTHGPGSPDPLWQTHLTASAPLFATLDAITTVPPTDPDFHKSWDHYNDALSARLCHSKPLPCNPSDPNHCVTPSQAAQVFRLGHYEYSHLYRDRPELFPAAVASSGIWIAELARHLRDAVSGGRFVRYRHHVAHDGSLAGLLAVLQVERMVWPGMGAEVVFELYRKEGEEGEGGRGFYVRVLWGGRVLRSSHPALGVMDMVPVEIVLGYFDGLVGVDASRVLGLCGE